MHPSGQMRKISQGRRVSNPIAVLRHIPIGKGALGGMRPVQGSTQGEGGTDMKGFFNQDGFEVVIWILVIIFLLSIFFDEGID
jgi:hypothetical protein